MGSHNIVMASTPPMNLARIAGVSVTASFIGSGDSVAEATDGIISYNDSPRNRWTCNGTSNAVDSLTFTFDFNVKPKRVRLYFYDDGANILVPASYDIQYNNFETWSSFGSQVKTPSSPSGNAMNEVIFTAGVTANFRVELTRQSGKYCGLTEVEIFSR